MPRAAPARPCVNTFNMVTSCHLRRYEQLLQARELAPLGMSSSRIRLSKSDWAKRVAPGHVDPTGTRL